MSSRVRLARIIDAPLSVDRLLTEVTEPRVGGVALFVGVVRNTDDGQDVVSLDYTQHPSADVELVDVPSGAAEERRRCRSRSNTGSAIWTSATSPSWSRSQRRTADPRHACAQLIDDLKATVPIWKEQHFTTGEASWVGLP